MIDYYKENIQIYILLSLWLVAGIFFGSLIYFILPVILVLLRKKEMYEEIFIGYLFVLLLSDSSDNHLLFAKGLKNEYITIIAIFFFFDKKTFSPFDTLYKIFLPFFFFSIITVFFAVTDSYFFTSVQKTISYFLMFLILPSYIIKLYRDFGSNFLKRFILFSFTTIFLGLLFRYISPNLTNVVGRFSGFFGGPNGLGVYCVILFIILFYINNLFPEMFSKYEKIILFATILVSIYLTGSRNAVLSVFIFYFFQLFFGSSPFLGIIIFITITILIELVSVNASSIVHFFGIEQYFRIQTLAEGSGRYVAWNFAWNQIQHNFFIGKGFGYNEFYMRQHYRFLSKLGHQGGIHNSFLTFWMDQGLIGLLIYLRSYILVFIKAAKKTKFAFPAMFAISFTAFFESWLVGSLSPFAFMGVFIFTILTNDEFKKEEEIVDIEANYSLATK